MKRITTTLKKVPNREDVLTIYNKLIQLEHRTEQLKNERAHIGYEAKDCGVQISALKKAIRNLAKDNNKKEEEEDLVGFYESVIQDINNNLHNKY